jgi:hypothetical protein
VIYDETGNERQIRETDTVNERAGGHERKGAEVSYQIVHLHDFETTKLHVHVKNTSGTVFEHPRQTAAAEWTSQEAREERKNENKKRTSETENANTYTYTRTHTKRPSGTDNARVTHAPVH